MGKWINAVELVRKIRDKQYEETKNMSDEEFIEYVREKAKKLNNKLKSKV